MVVPPAFDLNLYLYRVRQPAVMINKEDSKIENIKNLENIFKNKVVNKNVDELEQAKHNLEGFYSKLSEKFNSIKVQQLEETKEKEKLEKERKIAEQQAKIDEQNKAKQLQNNKPFQNKFGVRREFNNNNNYDN